MQQLEVGKPYPHYNHARGVEQARAAMNTSFFDVLYYSPTAIDDAPTWRKGRLQYGFYEPAAGIPFVLFELPNNWQFDVTLNLLKVRDDSTYADWLHSKGNTITLVLIDAKTNIVRGIRFISVPAGWAEEVREACTRQVTFADAQAVDTAIANASLMPLARMIRETQMREAGKDIT